MGRKTWMSIPEKNRPLKNRINVVVSQTLTGLIPPTYRVGSVEDAFELLSTAPLKDQVETVWIIGGQSLYQHAVTSPGLDRVYFTNILQKFECDAFFPVKELEKMERIVDETLPAEQREENGVPYKFEVYSMKTIWNLLIGFHHGSFCRISQ